VVACTPHPGLGVVIVRHVEVSLATCRTAPAPPVRASSGPRVVGATIVFHGKVVVRARKGDAVALDGTSPDGRWILYAIDPQGSASLAADGLPMKVVSARGGRPHPIAVGLLNVDYRGWCDGKLVVTAGGDRYAARHKWLAVAGPPSWSVRRIAVAPAFSFGSLACRGDGIVVQATRDRATTTPSWALWDFGLEGGMSVVDTPPRGTSDESPQVSRGGTIYFVRTRDGRGELYALRGGKLLGPLLSLGRLGGYFGHRSWPYTVRR
jgi:hypothetical protein